MGHEAMTKTPTVCCPPESVAFLPPPDDATADEQLATFAKALAHPIRVRIVKMLAGRDARMCADIVNELPLAQSTVSEHLRILREAKLIDGREDGVRTLYCAVPGALEQFRALLDRALPRPTQGQPTRSRRSARATREVALSHNASSRIQRGK